MQDKEYNADSAERIRLAATQLFALHGYDSVSVKQISDMACTNPALISYYYNGKRNLYLNVLNTQMEIFQKIILAIREKNASPRQKLNEYVDALAKFQAENPNQIHLIYREILSPQPMFKDFVKNKLYILHTFMTELVAESVKLGELHTNIQPTHVAFTLEGIILFYFLMHKDVKELGNFKTGEEQNYLTTALNSYLNNLQ